MVLLHLSAKRNKGVKKQIVTWDLLAAGRAPKRNVYSCSGDVPSLSIYLYLLRLSKRTTIFHVEKILFRYLSFRFVYSFCAEKRCALCDAFIALLE